MMIRLGAVCRNTSVNRTTGTSPEPMMSANIDLIIHHQQRGAPRIDVRKLRHGFLLADNEFSYDVPPTCSLSTPGWVCCKPFLNGLDPLHSASSSFPHPQSSLSDCRIRFI